MNGEHDSALFHAYMVISGAARDLSDTRVEAALPDDARRLFDGIAWTLGYIAAMIDPQPRDETETDTPHPFGAATEREH